MSASKSKHPDRTAILNAIKSGNVPFMRHLEACDDCRQMFELLKVLHTDPPSDDTPLPESIYRSRAIALLDSTRHPAQVLSGELAHDSWAKLPAQQVRGISYSGERHLRFRAGAVTLELIVEKIAGSFEMVARVFERGTPTTRFLLQVGRQKLYPENHQCYFWTAQYPPKNVALISGSTKLEFGTVRW